MSVCAVHKKDECAPSRSNEGGSCIRTEILISIAKAYNAEHSDQINFDMNKAKNKPEYKKYLVSSLEQRLGKDQRKWMDKKFISRLQDEEQSELKKRTFVPKGPQGKWDWLNTLHINEVMTQYEDKYKDYKFLGAVPIDFDDLHQLGIKNLDAAKLKSEGKTKIGIVFNLDEHWKSGSHWVSGYYDLKKGNLYFFDSYGSKPDKRVVTLMQRIGNQIYKTGIEPRLLYNRTRHQFGGSECGVYSMNFILRLLRGDSFDEISRNPIDDKKINECRDVYFDK